MSLARGAARGAAWNFATILAERAVGFAIFAVLLRVVPAPDVGIIAIAGSVSELVRIAANSGAGAQVQASPGNAEIEAGAFWSQLLTALPAMLALSAAAPWIAHLYGQPALSPLLRLMALNVVMTCFLIVPSARLASQFRFKAIGLISLGSTAAGGACALPLALGGHGLAALATQRMAGVAFYAFCACRAARWMPPPPPRLAALAAGFRFSLPMMQAAFVDYLALTGYVMLAGLRLEVVALAQFRVAQRLLEVLQELSFLPARKLLLPVLAAVRADEQRRREVLRRMLDLIAMLIFFTSAVSGAAAGPARSPLVRGEMDGGGAGFRPTQPHRAVSGALRPHQPAFGESGRDEAAAALRRLECADHPGRVLAGRAVRPRSAGLGISGAGRGGGGVAFAGAAPGCGWRGLALIPPSWRALRGSGGGAAGGLGARTCNAFSQPGIRPRRPGGKRGGHVHRHRHRPGAPAGGEHGGAIAPGVFPAAGFELKGKFGFPCPAAIMLIE